MLPHLGARVARVLGRAFAAFRKALSIFRNRTRAQEILIETSVFSFVKPQVYVAQTI
jgi:hypothetical protein